MVYGDGYASADDVVAHELTHAVTEHSADLLYYYQSGALNESMSDVFGETVDIETGNGNDTAAVRWLMGEDLPIGAIRNMMNPTVLGDPGKMSDSAQFRCVTDGWTNPNGDSGGVHTNSGIPNHAYALTVDGGSYNGRTVTGIGLLKAAKIWYRALTVYLTSGSTFLDSYNALIQSCSDLTGTNGITAANCTQVTTALQAVEMNQTWGCAGAVQAPALCPSGTLTTAYFDGAEASNANWVFESGIWCWWHLGATTGFGEVGHAVVLYGNDPRRGVRTQSLHDVGRRGSGRRARVLRQRVRVRELRGEHVGRWSAPNQHQRRLMERCRRPDRRRPHLQRRDPLDEPARSGVGFHRDELRIHGDAAEPRIARRTEHTAAVQDWHGRRWKFSGLGRRQHQDLYLHHNPTARTAVDHGEPRQPDAEGRRLGQLLGVRLRHADADGAVAGESQRLQLVEHRRGDVHDVLVDRDGRGSRQAVPRRVHEQRRAPRRRPRRSSPSAR